MVIFEFDKVRIYMTCLAYKLLLIEYIHISTADYSRVLLRHREKKVYNEKFVTNK